MPHIDPLEAMSPQERQRRYGSELSRPRFIVSGSAGSRPGKPYAVVDRLDRQSGKGMRRVSFHPTMAQARAEAKRLNESELSNAG